MFRCVLRIQQQVLGYRQCLLCVARSKCHLIVGDYTDGLHVILSEFTS